MTLRKMSIDAAIKVLKKKRYESVKEIDFFEENKENIEKYLHTLKFLSRI